jgi:hypothetical protein
VIVTGRLPLADLDQVGDVGVELGQGLVERGEARGVGGREFGLPAGRLRDASGAACGGRAPPGP